MYTTGNSAETTMPHEPLFASSWAALFRLIQAQFAPRSPVGGDGDAGKTDRPH